MLVRNAMFRRVELAALRRWIDLAELDAEAGGLDAGPLAGRDRRTYFAEHDAWAPARTPAARRCCRSRSSPGRWQVRQVIDDPEGDHDWGITAEVDLAASDEAGEAVVRTTGFEPSDPHRRTRAPAAAYPAHCAAQSANDPGPPRIADWRHKSDGG